MSYRILSVRDLGEQSFDWLIPDAYLQHTPIGEKEKKNHCFNTSAENWLLKIIYIKRYMYAMFVSNNVTLYLLL